jgi:plasmid stability protein
VAQLIVRKLEEPVVARLREEAAKYGISVEEAHRRVLREALLGKAAAKGLKAHLLAIPDEEGNEPEDLFERQQDPPREVEL